MKPLPTLERVVEQLEDAEQLDGVVKQLRKPVYGLPRGLADLLHGVPIGHPLHPALVLVPIGAYSSVAALDSLPGNERAAKLLVGVGLASTAPAVLAGYTDWSKLLTRQSRVGLVHAIVNVAASGLYLASLVQRSRGRHASGRMLGWAGFTVVMTGGFLGGHLSYRQTVGASHAWEVPRQVEPGWHRIGTMDELPEGVLQKRTVDDVDLVVLRRGSRVYALSDHCSHLTGPLHQGTIPQDTPRGEVCVQCPWHQSVFSMETGEVIHGPATAHQPRFETRVSNGVIEVRLADGQH